MPDGNELWARVLARWRRSKLAIRLGASTAALRDFESKWSIVLPHDVRAYFETVDGMEPSTLDDDAFSFWPLAEVKPVHECLMASHPDRWAYPDCFLIADWAI